MLFCPLASTVMRATPEETPFAVETPRTLTPASCSPLRRRGPKSSSPTLPIMVTGWPRRATATAWLAPLPPWKVWNLSPLRVSPGAGIRLPLQTRSRLMLPTTMMDDGIRAPRFGRIAQVQNQRNPEETVPAHSRFETFHDQPCLTVSRAKAGVKISRAAMLTRSSAFSVSPSAAKAAFREPIENVRPEGRTYLAFTFGARCRFRCRLKCGLKIAPCVALTGSRTMQVCALAADQLGNTAEGFHLVLRDLAGLVRSHIEQQVGVALHAEAVRLGNHLRTLRFVPWMPEPCMHPRHGRIRSEEHTS